MNLAGRKHETSHTLMAAYWNGSPDPFGIIVGDSGDSLGLLWESCWVFYSPSGGPFRPSRVPLGPSWRAQSVLGPS
eukprot:6210857-Pyramimonas_sp.AAC.1